MSENPILAMVRGKLADASRPFTLVVCLEAKPGRGADFAAAVVKSQAVRLSRQEKGCTAYDICQDAEAPDRFVVHECWHNLAALQKHLGTAHFAALGAALGTLLAAPPAIRVLTAVE